MGPCGRCAGNPRVLSNCPRLFLDSCVCIILSLGFCHLQPLLATGETALASALFFLKASFPAPERRLRRVAKAARPLRVS